jgi:hypothetical protein
MDPEDGDLEKVFNICDTDDDGFLSKEELVLILQDIGVEHEAIDEFMRELQSEQLISFTQFTDAIIKFRSSSLLQSVNSARVSPRSLAGSVLGGDHADCNFTIIELQSRNSVLQKQNYAWEAQIHELNLSNEVLEKKAKKKDKELGKVQARFTEVSAQLESAKQVNKDMSNRESELKRSLRELQEQRGSIEGDLLNTRAELENARSNGSSYGSIIKAPKIHPETQAELDRLTEALAHSETDLLQLRRANEELLRVNTDEKLHITVCVNPMLQL